jgi:uncharacterized protein
MVRPIKCRIIESEPLAFLFKPRGVPITELEQVCLTLDEFEAVRLADFEERYQAQAAERMGISRATFGNILASARRKVAEAIVLGKALKIDGGSYQTAEAKGGGRHA